MIGHRHKQARFQSLFYRDLYHKMLNALILSIFVMLCLIMAIIYIELTRAKPQFYATTTTGQIIPMVPRT